MSYIRWRCYVEEYAPKLFYPRGKQNVLADAFSRLPKFDSLEIIEGKSNMDNIPLEDPTSVMDFYTNIEEATLFDCLKYLPEIDDYYNTTHSLLNLPSTDDNLLSYVWLKDTQDEDPKLGELCNDPSSGFHRKDFAGEKLICFTEKIRTKTMIGKYVYLILQYIMQSNIFICF